GGKYRTADIKKPPCRGQKEQLYINWAYCAQSRKAARLSGLIRCQSCLSVVRVASLCGRVSAATALASGASCAAATGAAVFSGATVEASSTAPAPISELSRELLRWPRSPSTRSPVLVFTAQLANSSFSSRASARLAGRSNSSCQVSPGLPSI